MYYSMKRAILRTAPYVVCLSAMVAGPTIAISNSIKSRSLDSRISKSYIEPNDVGKGLGGLIIGCVIGLPSGVLLSKYADKILGEKKTTLTTSREEPSQPYSPPDD